jgi:pyruvate kinase
MMNQTDLEAELAALKAMSVDVPLYFDVKGRQLRVEEVFDGPTHMELRLNHAISVPTPQVVLFKAEKDSAKLIHLDEGGRRLIFEGGPANYVHEGESIHIRDNRLSVSGPTFTDKEKAKIELVRQFGFTRYFLSYVESQAVVDEFLELVGRDSEVRLKIENQAGLDFVATEFQKKDNLCLVAARGDLYIEVPRPYQILKAMRLIVDKDPEAIAASRLLLSIMQSPVPSCADFSELAWLYDIGYRSWMLCDEICLREDWLGAAINVLEGFRSHYHQ